MCCASASGNTVINKSTLCVQSGLKYNNLCGKCPERVHYNTLHRVTRQRLKRSADVLTRIICTARLKFFGHIARADPSMDHSRAVRSSVAPLSRDWNRRSIQPPQTWLCTVESDVTPLNIGLAAAYHRARNRQACRSLNDDDV